MNASRNTPSGPAAAGFTLIELAIALVVIGLLLGLLTPAIGARLEHKQVTETLQTLHDAQEALLGFAVANGRLPRPATSVDDGLENPEPCTDDARCTGFVPWQTLGIRKTDGWHKLIRYSVTPAYADGRFALDSVATKKIQSRNGAGILTYLVGGSGSCTSSPCAAAVLLSHGKNNWGTLESGAPLGDGSVANADEDANAGATTRFIARPPGNLPAGGEFDDLVVWLPTAILFNRMVAAGRLP